MSDKNSGVDKFYGKIGGGGKDGGSIKIFRQFFCLSAEKFRRSTF